MADKISQRPILPLDPPEQVAGGEVVAAARCPGGGLNLDELVD